MKILIAIPIVFLCLFVVVPPAQANGCNATGFYRDGINLTALMINPTEPVTGEVDATGCNIGVYFGPGATGTVSEANIHGANYFGVVVRGADVDVLGSFVYDIGENYGSGAQHGVAIYYATVGTGAPANPPYSYVQPACTTGTTTGTIDGNTVYDYQKGGITANCAGTTVTVTDNTVTGFGVVDFIAQNGIQFGYGASGEISGNAVTGNWYQPAAYMRGNGKAIGQQAWVSCGILLYGVDMSEIKVSNNQLRDNQVNMYVSPA